jgi:beta-phosphoglucomutase family hydrolase
MAPEARSLRLAARDYDAVVFDMDGVITDTATVHAAAWKRMFDDFLANRGRQTGTQFVPFSDEDYLRYVDGRPRDDGVEAFLESRGMHLDRGTPDDPPQRETVWGLANRKNREFLRTVDTEGVRAFPSSVELVRDLQAHGIPTAVISASRNAGRILEVAGVGDLFPVRVDGIELEHLGLRGKPAPDMFIEAARRLGATPQRSVVIEDAIAGVEAGRAGRFGLVVGVDRKGDGDALRAHGADIVVGDLDEVAVAS